MKKILLSCMIAATFLNPVHAIEMTTPEQALSRLYSPCAYTLGCSYLDLFSRCEDIAQKLRPTVNWKAFDNIIVQIFYKKVDVTSGRKFEEFIFMLNIVRSVIPMASASIKKIDGQRDNSDIYLQTDMEEAVNLIQKYVCLARKYGYPRDNKEDSL
ncbi:MAG: hypothetical protein Q8K36_03435 [Alphaproteobacteria bacterium]|nr:hypothetical protein [Alphaproteobacteria bacterium]